MKDSDYPCPACGFLAFGEPPGSYEICSVCGWEDDHVQLRFPGMAGGANKASLFMHQLAAVSRFPLSCKTAGSFLRASGWRPLYASEAHVQGTPSSGIAYFHAASTDDTPQYYWLIAPVATP